MQENGMAANRRLAELLGWTDIFDVGGALLGTPPPGMPSGRNQAKVPDWTGDWRDCGPLLAAYRMTVGRTSLDAMATCASFDRSPPGIAAFDEHESEDAAVRHAVVAALVGKLEAR